MLAAALGGRQLPRPEQLNVARRTLAFSLRGWHGIFASEDTAYIPDMSCQVSKRARHRQRQAETRQCERPPLSPGALRGADRGPIGAMGSAHFACECTCAAWIAALRLELLRSLR